jgi:hypothetical protein
LHTLHVAEIPALFDYPFLKRHPDTLARYSVEKASVGPAEGWEMAGQRLVVYPLRFFGVKNFCLFEKTY